MALTLILFLISTLKLGLQHVFQDSKVDQSVRISDLTSRSFMLITTSKATHSVGFVKLISIVFTALSNR